MKLALNLTFSLFALFMVSGKSFSLTDYKIKKICKKEKRAITCIKNSVLQFWIKWDWMNENSIRKPSALITKPLENLFKNVPFGISKFSICLERLFFEIFWRFWPPPETQSTPMVPIWTSTLKLMYFLGNLAKYFFFIFSSCNVIGAYFWPFLTTLCTSY